MANTARMNRLEELGRVDSEKAFTKKGKRNLKDEKKRIVRELKTKSGGRKTNPFDPNKDPKKRATKGFKKGGSALKPVNPQTQKGLSKLPTEVRNKMGYMKKGGRVMLKSGGIAKKGRGCEIR